MNIREMVAAIKARPGFKQADGGVYLSVYSVERCYGGPEEGGWWYDVRTLEGSEWFATEAEARAVEQELRAAPALATVRHEGAYDALGGDDTVSSSRPEGYIPTGWSDRTDYHIYVESSPGRHDNSHEPTPRYE